MAARTSLVRRRRLCSPAASSRAGKRASRRSRRGGFAAAELGAHAIAGLGSSQAGFIRSPASCPRGSPRCPS
eukprot:14068531-Alexandrium_andersonii.AAC.1